MSGPSTALTPGMDPSPVRRSARQIFVDSTLNVKILTLSLLALLLASVVGLTGQFAVADVRDNGNKITTVVAQRAIVALRTRAEFAGLRRDMLLAALAQGGQAVTAQQDVSDGFTEVTKGLKSLAGLGLDARDSAVLNEQIRPNYDKVRRIWTDELQPLAEGHDLTGAGYRRFGSIVTGTFAEAANAVKDGVNALADHANTAMAASTKDVDRTSRHAVIRIWIFTGVGVLLLQMVGWWIATLLSRSIAGLRTALQALAAGDLTHPITVKSRDEVGQMAHALQEAQDSLRTALHDINTTSITLAGNAQELSTVSAQVAQNSEQTSEQAASLSSTAARVSTDVQTVASGTQQMSASIQDISHSSAEAVRVATSAVAEAEAAGQTVAQLGESSTEIGNVIRVITSIAEQTNLLALNATIEAARAGQAGKGFAVVAEEVKQLAHGTARATDDISRRVEAIQADTEAAVAAITRITVTIEDINAHQTMIASAVEEQTATTSQIAYSISQAAHGTASIAGDITAVSQAADSSTRGISEAQHAATDVAALSSKLKQLVTRFTI